MMTLEHPCEVRLSPDRVEILRHLAAAAGQTLDEFFDALLASHWRYRDRLRLDEGCVLWKDGIFLRQFTGDWDWMDADWQPIDRATVERLRDTLDPELYEWEGGMPAEEDDDDQVFTIRYRRKTCEKALALMDQERAIYTTPIDWDEPEGTWLAFQVWSIDEPPGDWFV